MTQPTARHDGLRHQWLSEIRDGATYFTEPVRGVSLRYDLGGKHPLVGCSAPDFELLDGRLSENSSRVPNPCTASAACKALGRPDHVSGEKASDCEEAAQAASQWFGEPAASS